MYKILIGGNKMKYIIVGTSHAGYEVIQTLLKEDKGGRYTCI